jgi:hypothetical protein
MSRLRRWYPPLLEGCGCPGADVVTEFEQLTLDSLEPQDGRLDRSRRGIGVGQTAGLYHPDVWFRTGVNGYSLSITEW